MFLGFESEIITLIFSNIQRQPLNSFKTLTILSLRWSSAPLSDKGNIEVFANDTVSAKSARKKLTHL